MKAMSAGSREMRVQHLFSAMLCSRMPGSPQSDAPAPSVTRARKPVRRFDRGLADEIVAAVTRGAPMRRFLGSDRRLPCLAVVARWRAQEPAFAAELKMAMVVSRYVRGARRLWSDELEVAIVERMIEGASLRQVTAQPDMPCMTTLRNWSHRKAGFRDALAWAAEERCATAAAPMYRSLMAGTAARFGGWRG